MLNIGTQLFGRCFPSEVSPPEFLEGYSSCMCIAKLRSLRERLFLPQREELKPIKELEFLFKTKMLPFLIVLAGIIGKFNIK